MSTLKDSLRQTLAYARFFDFDLTLPELHFWLISPKIYSLPTVSRTARLSGIHLKSEILDLRSRVLRQRASQSKLKSAQAVARFLSLFPSIQLVAVTGSLAMDNAKKSDDIDLMVITTPNTLWLTRLFVIPLVRLFFKSRHPQGPTLKGAQRAPTKGGEGRTLKENPSTANRDAICLNLWLDNLALSVPASKRHLYTAHEVLQVRPLVNKNHTYQRFIRANSWTKNYLANAYKSITSSLPAPAKGRGDPASAGWVGSKLLNLLAFKFQFLYMRAKITQETITLHAAFFHPRSLAAKLDQYLKSTP